MKDKGIAIGLLLLLLAAGRKGGASMTPTTPKDQPGGPPQGFEAAWRERVGKLAQRATSGARWAPRMIARLGPGAGVAAARWIGIESGGNPLAASSLNERGLAQVMSKTYRELGLTDDDWNALASKETSDDRHADIAAQVIRGELDITRKNGTKGHAPGWGSPLIEPNHTLSVNGVGIAKLRHGLPLLVKELSEQGHLRVTIPLTLKSALTGRIGAGAGLPLYAPSDRLKSYATKATGDVASDLLIRFLAPAAVVAFAEDAASFGAIGGAGEVA